MSMVKRAHLTKTIGIDFNEPSRLQLSERMPQSDRLSLSESSTGATDTLVPRPPIDSPLSTLSHIEAEQPFSHSGQESSGPTGKHVACTDHGLHIPEAKCLLRKFPTRFSAFSEFLLLSSFVFVGVFGSVGTGKDRMKFGWGRDARTSRNSGSSKGRSAGDLTLKNER